MKNKIQQLVNEGYDIQCLQLRKLKNSDALLPQKQAVKAGKADSRGGLTVLAIRDPQGRTYFSIAQCSRQDNFNRSRGYEIALTRVYEELGRKRKKTPPK